MVTTLNSSSPGPVKADAAERSTPQTFAVETRLSTRPGALRLPVPCALDGSKSKSPTSEHKSWICRRRIVGLRAKPSTVALRWKGSQNTTPELGKPIYAHGAGLNWKVRGGSTCARLGSRLIHMTTAATRC